MKKLSIKKIAALLAAFSLFGGENVLAGETATKTIVFNDVSFLTNLVVRGDIVDGWLTNGVSAELVSPYTITDLATGVSGTIDPLMKANTIATRRVLWYYNSANQWAVCSDSGFQFLQQDTKDAFVTVGAARCGARPHRLQFYGYYIPVPGGSTWRGGYGNTAAIWFQ